MASHTADETTPKAEAPVVDALDTSPRAPQPDTSGKRVRAIPYQNGSTVIVDQADFRGLGIEHPQVKWDFRVNRFTVKVGQEISLEAAEALTKNFKETFEYIDG
jgi:hypothetical protein